MGKAAEDRDHGEVLFALQWKNDDRDALQMSPFMMVKCNGDVDGDALSNAHLVARGDSAGEKDGDMAAWAGGPVVNTA